MTLVKDDDSDSMEPRLTPAERYIYEQMKLDPDQPHSFLNFKEKYSHGTIRNIFSKLHRNHLIRLYCRSPQAFYLLASSTMNEPSKPVTVNHKVGRGNVKCLQFDFGAFLDSLDLEEVCRVHDVVLSFQSDRLYDLLIGDSAYRLLSMSMDVQLDPIPWILERQLTVRVHRNSKVTAYLKCSRCPIEVTLQSLSSLSAFLGSVRKQLTDLTKGNAYPDNEIPDVTNWVVVQWHYGKDGIREISGPSFNVTFSTWFEELARIYMRKRGHLSKPRFEIVEKPRKTLAEAFADKIQPFLNR